MLSKIKCEYRKGIFTKDECLKCALDGENKCPYTYALLSRMLKESTRDEEDPLTVIHVTDLLGCPRSSFLRKTLKYIDSIDNLYIRARGTAFHYMLETSEKHEDIIREKSIELPFSLGKGKGRTKKFKLKGRFDEFNTKTGTLIDYKSTKEVPKYNYAYTYHSQQLMIYAYMINKILGYKVKNIEVVYMDPSKAKRVTVKDTPMAETEAFIKQRLTLYVDVIKNPEGNTYELGYSCKFCPVSIRSRCWALIIKHSYDTNIIQDIDKLADIFESKTPIDFVYE